jgi:hypothetical protein
METEKPSSKSSNGNSGKATSKFAALKGNRRIQLRIAVIFGALAVGLIAWLATRDSGSSSEPASSETAASRIVDLAELQEAAATLGQPIYWAGSMTGKQLQLNELGEGGVQVLYLPEGVRVGKRAAQSLTIGSYPLPDPTTALKGYAKRHDSVVRSSPERREAVTSKRWPTSVYFTSPENAVQVEVYDPSPKQAMSLALSKRVEPVN